MMELIKLIMVPVDEESSRSNDWQNKLQRLEAKPVFSATLRISHSKNSQVSDTMKNLSYRARDGTIHDVLIDSTFLPTELHLKMRNCGVNGYVLGEKEGFILYGNEG